MSIAVSTNFNASRWAVYYGFLIEGLCDSMYDDTIEAWGNGCHEMHQYVLGYMPTMLHMANAAFAVVGEWPGAYSYEVAALAGMRFGELIRKHRGEVPEEEVLSMLRKHTTEFFAQGGEWLYTERIETALSNIKYISWER